ncbi:MAG TPA: TIM barrel protein [Abditibacterium sp.]|jgi:sugar phosphate isomerase/epimerase
MTNLKFSTGVSSWAVHDDLGAPPISGVESGAVISDFKNSNAAISLLELPAELAKRGFDCLQICQFHLPTRDAAYLDELRASIESSGLQLHALLADDGDLTHPENGARDENWIADWLPIAAKLGAKNVRVIAGKTKGEDALQRSAAALKRLAAQGESQGVSIITENWFDLLDSPAAVHELLGQTEGKIGFLLDFGNWNGEDKHEKLAQIAPLANSCHAKAEFLESGALDEADYARSLRLPYSPEFRGPFVLVNGGLNGIGKLRDFIGQI